MNTAIRLRESQVPHGNVIVTAEYAPDIGESGTARTFIIKMQPGSMNLPLLTDIQSLAADGMLMRCMYGYIEWLKVTYLTLAETVQDFVSRQDLSRGFSAKVTNCSIIALAPYGTRAALPL